MEYGKTENLFTRNPETHKLNMGELRAPEVGLISHWLVTEKIDGTNIRLTLDWADGIPSWSINGRTDRANVPGDLVDWIAERITVQFMIRALCSLQGCAYADVKPCKMVVYGEGYGPGIGKGGGLYAPEKRLRIFDVITQALAPPNEQRLDEWIWGPPYWRPFSDVEKVAGVLALNTVPVLTDQASLDYATELVVRDTPSLVAARESTEIKPGMYVSPEGIVARTDPYLFDGRGNRIMWKLKRKDLPFLRGVQ